MYCEIHSNVAVDIIERKGSCADSIFGGFVSFTKNKGNANINSIGRSIPTLPSASSSKFESNRHNPRHKQKSLHVPHCGVSSFPHITACDLVDSDEENGRTKLSGNESSSKLIKNNFIKLKGKHKIRKPPTNSKNMTKHKSLEDSTDVDVRLTRSSLEEKNHRLKVRQDRLRAMQQCQFMDNEAMNRSDDSGDDNEETLVRQMEDDDSLCGSLDGFINDSSQLGFSQDELGAIESGRLYQDEISPSSLVLLNATPGCENALHRKLDHARDIQNVFATPVLNRRMRRRRNDDDSDLDDRSAFDSWSPTSSNGNKHQHSQSSLKGLGNMCFIRSVVEHHKLGGTATQIETEFENVFNKNDNSQLRKKHKEKDNNNDKKSGNHARFEVIDLVHDTVTKTAANLKASDQNVNGFLDEHENNTIMCKSFRTQTVLGSPLKSSNQTTIPDKTENFLLAEGNDLCRVNSSTEGSKTSKLIRSKKLEHAVTSSIIKTKTANNRAILEIHDNQTSNCTDLNQSRFLTAEQKEKIEQKRLEALRRRQKRMQQNTYP